MYFFIFNLTWLFLFCLTSLLALLWIMTNGFDIRQGISNYLSGTYQVSKGGGWWWSLGPVLAIKYCYLLRIFSLGMKKSHHFFRGWVVVISKQSLLGLTRPDPACECNHHRVCLVFILSACPPLFGSSFELVSFADKNLNNCYQARGRGYVAFL